MWQVDEKTFEQMVEYSKSMQGGGRQWAVEDAARVEDIAAQLVKEAPPPGDDKDRVAGHKRELGRMNQRKTRAHTLTLALAAPTDEAEAKGKAPEEKKKK
jgi:hypothetical protein